MVRVVQMCKLLGVKRDERSFDHRTLKAIRLMAVRRGAPARARTRDRAEGRRGTHRPGLHRTPAEAIQTASWKITPTVCRLPEWILLTPWFSFT